MSGSGYVNAVRCRRRMGWVGISMSGSGYVNAVGCRPADGLGWVINVRIWICKRRRLSVGGWAGLGSQCLDLDM